MTLWKLRSCLIGIKSHLDKDKVRQVDAKSSASHKAPTPEKGSVAPRLESKNGPHNRCPDNENKKFENKPSCFYCSLQGRSERHFLSKCNAFSRLSANARKEVVVKSAVA